MTVWDQISDQRSRMLAARVPGRVYKAHADSPRQDRPDCSQSVSLRHSYARQIVAASVEKLQYNAHWIAMIATFKECLERHDHLCGFAGHCLVRSVFFDLSSYHRPPSHPSSPTSVSHRIVVCLPLCIFSALPDGLYHFITVCDVAHPTPALESLRRCVIQPTISLNTNNKSS